MSQVVWPTGPELLWNTAPLLAGAYLAGSVNFAIVVMRLAGKEDPRTVASQNPGVTNVHRQAGLLWAAVVLLLELGRSAGVALAALRLAPGALVPFAGLALILGNIFPCFHGLRGGKGVANLLGFTALLCPWAAAGSALCWVALFAIVRVSFVASFLMVTVLAAGGLVFGGWSALPGTGTVLSALFVLGAHHGNVRALVKERRQASRKGKL